MKYSIISDNSDGSISVGFFSRTVEQHVTVAVVGNPDFFGQNVRPHADTVRDAEAIVDALNALASARAQP